MIAKKLINSLNKRIVAIYVLTFALVPIIQLGVMAIYPSLFESDANIQTFSAGMNLVWYVLLTSLLFYFTWIYLFKNQWLYFKKNPRRSFALILLGIFLMLSMNIFINTAFTVLDMDLSSQNQASLETLMDGRTFDLIALVIFAGVLAPIAEEIVFRKGLYGLIYNKFGNFAAIIGSGLLFGLIHVTGELTNVISLAPYFGLGIILGFIYYYSSKMIFIPIAVHAALNIFSLISLLSI
jgi:membrane protease YdiL (CAAX protease family)